MAIVAQWQSTGGAVGFSAIILLCFTYMPENNSGLIITLIINVLTFHTLSQLHLLYQRMSQFLLQ